MQRIVYGVFPDRARAEAADEALNARAQRIDHESEVATAAIHEHEIRPKDLPSAGNFALWSALWGGLVVGGSAAAFLGLLEGGAFTGIGGPTGLVGGSLINIVFVGLAAGAFGAVGSGIAGTAGKRAKFRELEVDTSSGRVVLTLEAPINQVRKIRRTMREHGALRTGQI